MSVRIYVRDKNLRRIGQVDDWQNLQVKMLFNAAGRWTVDLDASTEGAALFDTTNGVIIEYAYDGVHYEQLMTGPVDDMKRSYADGSNRLTVSGPDDNVWLSRRFASIAAPTTKTDGTARYPTYNVTHSGPAESVIKQFVAENATTSALDPMMPVPALTVAEDQSRGPTISYTARFDILSDLVTVLALQGNDMAWQITQQGLQLVFDVYPQRDVSGFAKFSVALRNLAAFDYERKAPIANYYLVAGGNDPTKGQLFDGAQLTGGSAVLLFPQAPSFDDSWNNALVAGSNIPNGATVDAVISPTQFRMSQPATGDSTNQQITIGGYDGETYGGGHLVSGTPNLSWPNDSLFDDTMVGDTITGTGIPDATTIASVQSPTQATLSQNPTAAGSAITIHVGGTTGTAYDGGFLVNGSPDLIFPHDVVFNSGMVGQDITGTGIPSGTTVATFVSPSEITMSNNSTADIGSETVTVGSNRGTKYSGAFMVAGSDVVNFPNINLFNDSSLVGKSVSGSGIAGGTTLASIVNDTQAELSTPAIADIGSATLTIGVVEGDKHNDCTTVAGSHFVSCKHGFPSGVTSQLITGAGIPYNTVVTGQSAAALTLSNGATINSKSTTLVLGGTLGTKFSGAFLQDGGTAVSIPDRPAFDGSYIGATVTGAGLPANTTISGVNAPNEIVLSNAAVKNTGSGSLTITIGTPAVKLSGAFLSTSSANVQIPLRPAFDGTFVGQAIAGAGIPAGTTISAFISTNEVTLSQPATADKGSVKVTIGAAAGTIFKSAAFTTDSSSITVPGRPTFTSSYVGQAVKGTGVLTGSVIAAVVSAHEVILDHNATKDVGSGQYTVGAVPGTTYTGASLTDGSVDVAFPHVPAFDSTYVDQLVTGTGIPEGTYVENVISSTQITMTQTATQDAAAQSVRVGDEQMFLACWDPDSIAFWGLIAGKLISQNNVTDLQVLAQAGLNQLAKDADILSLATTTMDTYSVAFMNQWGMNNVVAVEVDGAVITDAIREIDLTWSSADTPVEIKPVIGSPDATHPQVPRIFKNLKALAARLTYAERNATIK